MSAPGARKARRRAVIVSVSANPTGGGLERFTHLLDRALTGAGWDTTVATPARWPPKRVYQVGASAFWLARSAAQAVAAVPAADLVISNRELGAFLGPVPRIHVYHGTMVGHTLQSSGELPRRERLRRVVGYGLAERVAGQGAVRVAVSESTADEVERYYRLKVAEIVPNAVDATLFRPRNRAEVRAQLGLRDGIRYALFVGRADTTKGAGVLLPACRDAGWELLVAGCTLEGARSLGVLQPEALALAYSAADAVVFPTHYEACSFVVLEALASGTPLVTTEVGWMRTFLHAFPSYRPLVVVPTVADTVRGLRAVESLDPSVPAEAREWVATQCGLDRFASTWAALAERVADARDGQSRRSRLNMRRKSASPTAPETNRSNG